MFKLGGRNITLFLFININVYTFTIINFKTKQMVKLNLSEESTNHLVDMYEARIDALQKNIKKLKLIIDDSIHQEKLDKASAKASEKFKINNLI